MTRRMSAIRAFGCFLSLVLALTATDAVAALPATGLFTLKKGSAWVSPTGRLDVWAIPFVGTDGWEASGTPAREWGFKLRHARLGLQGGLVKSLTFSLGLELGDPLEAPNGLLDAAITHQSLDWFAITLGVTKVPFSYIQAMPSSGMISADHPRVVEALAPGRQLGAIVAFPLLQGAIDLQVGVFNAFDRYDDGFALGYDKAGLFKGDKEVGVAFSSKLSLHLGGAMEPTLADLGRSSFKAAVSGGFLFVDGADASLRSWTASAHMKLQGAHLAAEYIQAVYSPLTGAEVRQLGLVVEAGYTMLERILALSIRGELVDPDMDADTNGDQLVMSLAAFAYPFDTYLKIGLQFDYVHELAGAELSNNTVMVVGELLF